MVAASILPDMSIPQYNVQSMKETFPLSLTGDPHSRTQWKQAWQEVGLADIITL